MELHELTVSEMRHRLRKREVSAVDLARAAVERVASVDGKVKAFVTVTDEQAVADALAAQKRIDAGEDGALLGVPVALKDNLCTKGVRTSCSSKILADYRPPYNATVVDRLREAGAVVIGKTNLDEFAMGSSTENSGLFTTRNPWNLDCVPGGSSGGSAAAVAAGESAIALGSDTGGSVRLPAAFCGVVGLKPTYGRVSRYGLVAYASSLDQIGPFARDAHGCAAVMNAISGRDARDSTSVDVPTPDFTDSLNRGVEGLRIGVPKEFFVEGIDAAVQDAVTKAIGVLTDNGAVAEETSLPLLEYGLPVYYIVAPAECSSNLARFDGVKYGLRVFGKGHVGLTEMTREAGFGDEVKQRIMIGAYALSAGYYDAYYLKALKVRTLIRQDFDRVLERFDVIATPVSPTVAFRIDEKINDPLAMKLSDVCTVTVNLAGLPGISVPCGFSDGLPIGLQLIGRSFDEATLFQAAYAYEQATDWHRRRPSL